jgi:ADP-ribosylglycohydrolase
MKNRTMNGTPVSLKSAVRGALWGVSLGDAYGMPMEMWSREKSRSVFGKVEELLPGHPENTISHGRLAGETTDDSAFTRLICDLIIRDGDVDPMKFVSGIDEWLERGGEKNDLVLGPSTRKALEAIEKRPASRGGRKSRPDRRRRDADSSGRHRLELGKQRGADQRRLPRLDCDA